MTAKNNPDVRLKRAYEKPSAKDGARLLVDRLWPRGLRKEDLAIDRWLKELAPSDDLRRWFGHDPDRWDEFRRRYLEELSRRSDLVDALREEARRRRLTLVYAARDSLHNQAVILRDLLVE